MGLFKRYYCAETVDGETECFVEDGFWYTERGIIIKWIVFAVFVLIFFGWFVGGRIHAKRRLRKGLPLLAYHRFLISYSERRRFGQVPQNHFTFYQTQNPYNAPPPNGPYAQRQDGAWAEPPPLYTGDAPPQYFNPAAASKANPNQSGPVYAMEMGQVGPQQTGVVGASQPEQGQSQVPPPSSQPLPPRPAQAKIMGVLGRLRRS